MVGYQYKGPLFYSCSILEKKFGACERTAVAGNRLCIGMNGEYIEGIFVSEAMQSQGIGKILLNYVKDIRSKLFLNVYQKNIPAISFYQREGFEIQYSGLDEATGEKDYVMVWQQK